ncbi:MAG: hypothetical protein RQ875_01475 [Vicingaceae bacterium]|nr:hypothetical protein [Vicingaceae bacterium]
MKYFLFSIVFFLFISCNQSDNNDEIIAINNEFIESNFHQRIAVTMMDLRSFKNIDTTYTLLNDIEKELKEGNDITDKLDSLIPKWKSNFDATYSLDYFERVDRNFALFKKLNNNKDSNQVKNLFYMIKYEMINRYLVDIDGPCTSPYNHKVITVVEPSNIARVGEELNLNIFYAAQDSLMSYKVFIGGYFKGNFRSDLITDTVEVENGLGNYKLTPKNAGDTLIEGVIEIMTKNGPVYYPFSKKLTIFE